MDVMCLPDLENLTSSKPSFYPITHQYTIFDRKAPNLLKLGTLYNFFFQILPINAI